MTARNQPWIPPAQTVPEAIDWWASATPDAPALLGVDGDVISFGQLQMRIDEFARQLAAVGIGRHDRVVLALPDGVGAAVAGLATLRAAIGVPVNPAQSLAEATPLLAAVAPRAIVVGPGGETPFREAATRAGIPVITLDAAGMLQVELDDAVGQIEPLSPPSADELAMILLTSGTTDVPRRVPTLHGNVLATCSARVRARRLSPRDRGLSPAPAYFVLGLARVIESLISGGSAIVTGAGDIVRRPQAVRDLAPTWAWTPPALLETILDAARDNPVFSEWPLRFVRSGGARVTPGLIARGQALWGVPVLNGYGTTETLGYISAEESPELI
ncbi:MAG: AMP-binding protein, partial [Thermomicrobiales bacterium]